MKTTALLLLVFSAKIFAQNPLNIPTTLSGQNINLTLQNGTTMFYPSLVTNTMGANGSLLGPTLILSKDSLVNISVNNQISETTTIHWHGLHVAPENDGGPHTTILPNATWNPQFTIMDKAGTYWYHPHLHMQTDKHVSKGIAGLILVRDAEEQTLGLPMNYGVDEFPIIMQTKGFDAAGQIVIHTELDTSVMVNGTVDPVVDLPAQVVRLRLLNGSSQRVFEVGFSDNRQFSLIGTDGGLLTAPVVMTRYRIAPGQRADVLVDLSTSLGQNIQLMSYASELPNAIYGATQPGMGAGATASLVGYTSNPLNGNDFQLLDINVVSQTANPVLTIPTSLATFSHLLEGTQNTTRNLTFTSATMGNLAGPFLINNTSFDMGVINYTIPLNNVEIWTLTNQTPIAHPFHIHDVQFHILDINGVPPPPHLQGFNDVVLVPGGNGVVRFIAEFNHFSNDSIPYMYHCHMLTHEDMGMMGQFLVVSNASAIETVETEEGNITIFPNPTNNQITIQGLDEITKIEIFTIDGVLVQSIISSHTSELKIDAPETEGYYFIVFSNEVGRQYVRKIIRY